MLADVHMMLLCEGGRERSEEEMRALVGKTGFRPERMHRTPVFMGLLEGVAA